jgi:hypothetical protein
MVNLLTDLQAFSLVVKREPAKVTFASIIIPRVGNG